ncbi:hypothetical protein ZIOFF_003125 [Zingiber officinale]|uniref:GDP-mannose transporter n=1 Tax=Zingiber officinale TaxID=94328 RepID=A0A8J5M9Z3_ZINOF|nr:hypothetical protein ZIOFF_003125 [Zingiber officinale]
MFIYRPLSGVKSFEDDMDLENGKDDNGRDKPFRYNRPLKLNNQAFLSGLAYCLSSCSMILVNKFVLSGYDFSAGISLMLYQNFVSVILVSTLSSFGVVSTEPLTWKLIKVWLPVNIIFVGMLATSMLSLKYINVAMVTVLKNATNVITAIGEMYLFMKHHDGKVWTALILMVTAEHCNLLAILMFSFHIAEISTGIKHCSSFIDYIDPITAELKVCYYDLAFFMLCFPTTQLTLRRVMDTAKQVTKSGNLNEFSMVILNNMLSLPLGLLLIFASNEVDYLYKTPLLKMPMFWLVTTLSGFLGLAISFTSMWFLHQTGATTYSLVGSLNKIPLSLAGILLFKVPTSLENLFSILFGLLAGVFFARAKM